MLLHEKKSKSLLIVLPVLACLAQPLSAAAISDGSYSLNIKTTPVDLYGVPQFGSDGNWNSGAAFVEYPGTNTAGGSVAMIDNGDLVITPTGPFGSSLGGDGFAGSLVVTFSNGSFIVNTFQVDTIGLDSGGGSGLFSLAQQSLLPGQSGTVDPVTGEMILDMTTREGVLSNNGDVGRWNIDEYNNIGAWVPFTTGTIQNRFGNITGTPIHSVGDINGDGLEDYEGVLVSAGFVGSDFISLYGLPYFEMWRFELVSGPVCFGLAVDFVCLPDLTLILSESVDPVISGEIVNYGLDVANRGTTPAFDVWLDANVFVGTGGGIQSVTSNGGSCTTTGSANNWYSISCNFDILGIGETADLSIDVLSGTSSTVEINAEVLSSNYEEYFYDNSVTEITTVVIDMDRDGSYAGVDCDDDNPLVYPGAVEIKHDGIDQDCNGYDLTIDIVSAIYDAKRNTYNVVATSARGADAALSVTGYGAMKYSRKSGEWKLGVRKVDVAPQTVTVSGIEGAETAAVQLK